MEDDDKIIVKPLSAYLYFSKLSSERIKEKLIEEGKDSSLGAHTSEVSVQWRALSADERKPYEKLAKDDKARYEKECAVSEFISNYTFPT